ncbi:glycosyltransferase family 32 protein [Lyophyllum atratum]|nr:glycosyltransferase family 32 protein [Lyophyllum atratum]
MARGGEPRHKLPMYTFQESAPRLRSATVHHRYDTQAHNLSPPPSANGHDQEEYTPYLPPPSPTYRSRGRRWPCSLVPLPRRRTVRKFLNFALPLTLLVLLIGLYLYEPHIEIALYSRAWVHREIDPILPLSGCFEPLRVSPNYNVSDALYGRRRTEVQAGLPLKRGLDCYDFAGTVQVHRDDVRGRGHRVPADARTQFHTYWRTDLVPFGPRQEWMIKSFFATQDVAASRLVVWSNGDLTKNEILRGYVARYPEAFALRVVDIPMLAKSTELHGSELLKMKDKKAWLDGDLLRLLLLWNYGGVWVDMDSLLTRDLAPLLEHEFVTQWDCYDKPYQPLNGALMRFRQNSPYLCEAFHIMANSPPPRIHSTDWGSLLYLKLWRRLIAHAIPPFKVLPFCFSDGRSCRLDNRLPDPFAPDNRAGKWTMGLGLEEGGGLDEVLGKVFGVHLHNQWEKGFPSGGWVERLLLRRYEQRLRGLEVRGLLEGDEEGEEL